MTRCFAASHLRSASLIAGFRSETTRVTSLSESARHEVSASSVPPTGLAGSNKVVTNKNNRVFVFIDPRQRLKRGHAFSPARTTPNTFGAGGHTSGVSVFGSDETNTARRERRRRMRARRHAYECSLSGGRDSE